MSRISMIHSFFAFHVNALSNIVYMITTNYWVFLVLIGLFGTIVLNLKEEIDVAFKEEQQII